MWFHLKEISRTDKFIVTESRLEVPGAEGWEERRVIINGYRISVLGKTWGKNFGKR